MPIDSPALRAASPGVESSNAGAVRIFNGNIGRM